MDSAQETRKLSQSFESAQKINYNRMKWNCATSKTFLQGYIRDLKIDSTVDGPTHGENRRETRSTAKRVKLYFEQPRAWKYQEGTNTKTVSWHEKLCKCDACLKMYQNHNVEFLFYIKNIQWLPTEILLKIFKHLQPTWRRMASECCNRFLQIWFCDDFADDRHCLVFDKRVLEPAIEPLGTVPYRNLFNHLVLRNVIKSEEETYFPASHAKTITTLEFPSNFKHRLAKNHEPLSIVPFLAQFPYLRTIYCPINLWTFSEVPKTVELLVITKRRAEGYYDWFSKKPWESRKSGEIPVKTSDSFRIELMCDIEVKHLVELTETQRNKIQKMRMYFHQLQNTVVLQIPRLVNLKYLEVRFDEQHWGIKTEDHLANLEEQCPALEHLSIDIHHQLPHKNWNYLKKLTATNIKPEELPRLGVFENLTELQLSTTEKCFFLHVPFVNKNLKTFGIVCYSETNPCLTCYQAVIKSEFPNLKDFSCNFKITDDNLKELIINTPSINPVYRQWLK